MIELLNHIEKIENAEKDVVKDLYFKYVINSFRRFKKCEELKIAKDVLRLNDLYNNNCNHIKDITLYSPTIASDPTIIELRKYDKLDGRQKRLLKVSIIDKYYKYITATFIIDIIIKETRKENIKYVVGIIIGLIISLITIYGSCQ